MTKPTFTPPNRWIMRDVPELGLTISRVLLSAFDHCYPNGYVVTYSQLAKEVGCDFKTVAASLDVAAELGLIEREEARDYKGHVSGVTIRMVATRKPEKMPSKADIRAMYSRFLALRKRSTSANPFAPEAARADSGEPIPETTGVVSGTGIPETTGVHALKPPGSRPETTGVASLSSPVGQVVHPPLADERTDRTEDGYAREARSPSSMATPQGATPSPVEDDERARLIALYDEAQCDKGARTWRVLAEADKAKFRRYVPEARLDVLMCGLGAALDEFGDDFDAAVSALLEHYETQARLHREDVATDPTPDWRTAPAGYGDNDSF